MIVVDSSVWIARLRGIDTPATDRFGSLADQRLVLLGDLILLEVLQGTRSERHAADVERLLRVYPVVPMLDDELTVSAARRFRLLRTLGISVRKTADLIIANFCVSRGYALLHQDRDFDLMAGPLGLTVA